MVELNIKESAGVCFGTSQAFHNLNIKWSDSNGFENGIVNNISALQEDNSNLIGWRNMIKVT